MTPSNDTLFQGYSDIYSAKEYPNLYQCFLSSGFKKSFSCGESLVFQNEELSALGLFIQGSADIEVISSEGDLLTAGILGAGSVLNAPGYLDRGRSPVTLVAKQDCEVLFLPYKKIESCSQLDLEATRLAGRCAAYLYRSSSNLLSNSLLLSLDERVLNTLIRLQDQQEKVTITAEKLASHLVVSKHKVHRVLKQLQSAGVIENSYGAVKVLRHEIS